MYDKAHKSLAKYRDTLTNQEIHTLRGQITAGQAEAAMKGLKALLERKRHEKIDFWQMSSSTGGKS